MGMPVVEVVRYRYGTFTTLLNNVFSLSDPPTENGCVQEVIIMAQNGVWVFWRCAGTWEQHHKVEGTGDSTGALY
jgi:hypothetical protein